jgi:hypothetical protein
MSQLEGGTWEGLGGPIRPDRPNFADIDPTLESCCRREEEEIRYGNSIRRTLQKHDIVAEKERRRRHLVETPEFTGCRCCYDPNSDGGEYRALMELREKIGVVEVDVEEEAILPEEKKHDLENEHEDSEEDEFDYLLDEDLPEQNEELKALEFIRRAELEMAWYSREVSLQHGYGVHRQMHPARVLKAAGLVPGTRDPPPAVVLHLVDADSMASATLDLYLEKLAGTTARGTKFLRSGGRSVLLMDADLAKKVLPKMHPDKEMPALVSIRDGVVINTCPNLRGLVDEDDEIVPNAVYEWLDKSGVLLQQPPILQAVCRIRPEEEALMDYMTTQKPQREEVHFNCGVANCSKTFAHEHVGVKNEQQDGLLVSEEQILGVEES